MWLEPRNGGYIGIYLNNELYMWALALGMVLLLSLLALLLLALRRRRPCGAATRASAGWMSMSEK